MLVVRNGFSHLFVSVHPPMRWPFAATELFLYRFVCERESSFLWGKCPEMQSLGQMVLRNCQRVSQSVQFSKIVLVSVLVITYRKL